jgi:hypothetical protein
MISKTVGITEKIDKEKNLYLFFLVITLPHPLTPSPYRRGGIKEPRRPLLEERDGVR